MAPVNGYVVLAARHGSSPPGPVTLETYGPDALLTATLAIDEPSGYITAGDDLPTNCAPTVATEPAPPAAQEPPPPPEPAPPTDADQARAAVIEVFERYNDGSRTPEERALDVDDPTGVAEAHHKINETYADRVAGARGSVVDVFFETPTRAAVTYRIDVQGSPLFTDRLGYAVQIDGVWKVTHETACNDIAMGGVDC